MYPCSFLFGSAPLVPSQLASPCLIGRLNRQFRSLCHWLTLRFLLHKMLSVSESTKIVTIPPKSFAAAFGGTRSFLLEEAPYLVPCIKGHALSIWIGQDEYFKGLAQCQYALRGQMTLNKGVKPCTTHDLASKLDKVWKMVHKWKMVSLGMGYYDFLLEHPDDQSRIWAAGTVSLQPGLLRLSQWTKYFNHNSQKQTHASTRIRLVELPQEYWRERTLKEIGSDVGTLISLDAPTRNKAFGHYARILVEIDSSKRVYDEILVEQEGFAFKVEVQYERRPLFFHHYYVIGHNVTMRKWLNLEAAKDTDRGAKGASSSSTLQYVAVVEVDIIVTRKVGLNCDPFKN